MSRCATRARRRYARTEEQLADRRDRIVNARNAEERDAATEELIRLLKRVADSDERLWPVAVRVFGLGGHSPGGGEDAEATKALIAQIVAGRLAGNTPGSVRRRHTLSK